jgi:hypothetical protein
MNNCKYWSDGTCLLNKYDGKPSAFECANCMALGKNKPEGLGDTIAKLINKTPLRRLKKKGCGCKARQEKLNRMVNYGSTEKSPDKSS